MSDGAVSILGLVMGVAAGADSGNAVLLAGATGAIAASVSMMASTYLEIESTQDVDKVKATKRDADYLNDPKSTIRKTIGMLKVSGFSKPCIDAIQEEMKADPTIITRFEKASTPRKKKSSTIVHAFWMGISNLVAGLTPVLPFAFLPFAKAQVVCISGTAVLLLLLGIGRARLGNRSVIRTVLETMGIATAAAIAGVLAGRLIQ